MSPQIMDIGLASDVPTSCFAISCEDDDVAVLLSPRTVSLLNWILLAGLCQGIAVFGTCANIVNIICFVKQGFKDSVDISLFGLAVSDLGSLITIIWSNICNTPAFSEADLPFEVTSVFYLTSVMPHLTFVRITAWITALITLERCLCITIPLKIKNLITVKRVSIIVACVFLICIATGSPMYAISRLGLAFFPPRNKTLVMLLHTAGKDAVEKPTFTVNNTVIPCSAFVVISVCTLVLVIKLHKTTKWRKRSAVLGTADVVSNRTQKVAKMVVMISAQFIACFIPMSVLMIAIWLVPGLVVNGKNMGTLLVIGGIGTILESINASSNIFIYYYMSSKYNSVFRGLFCIVKTRT